jgi:hypothetical protein
MVALTKQEKEVVDRFEQLPPDRQRYIMLLMFRSNPGRWRHYQSEGEQHLRNLAADHGKDWEQLNDEQRQDFVNRLLHETSEIPKPGGSEWLKAFDAWVSSHPARQSVADDSRDTIYGDERD